MAQSGGGLNVESKRPVRAGNTRTGLPDRCRVDGGRSIDRFGNRRSWKPRLWKPTVQAGRSVDAGLADIVAVSVELADPVAAVAGGDHIGRANIARLRSDSRADDDCGCEADAETEAPAARLRFAAGTGVEGLWSFGRNGEFSHLLMEDVYWRTLRKTAALANWVESTDRSEPTDVAHALSVPCRDFLDTGPGLV